MAAIHVAGVRCDPCGAIQRIAYGLDGPGIESRWGARLALRPIQPPVQWVPGLSRG